MLVHFGLRQLIALVVCFSCVGAVALRRPWKKVLVPEASPLVQAGVADGVLVFMDSTKALCVATPDGGARKLKEYEGQAFLSLLVGEDLAAVIMPGLSYTERMELWDTKRQRCVVVEDNVIAATIVGDTAYALKSGDRGVMLEARLGEDGSMERTIHALPFDVHKAWAIDVSPNQQWLLMSPTNGDFYRLNLSRGTSDSIPLWRNLINLGLGPACISSAGEPFAYTICPGDNCIASLAVPEGLLRDKWIIGRWRARTGDALCGIEDNDLVFLSLLSKRHISMGLNAQRVNATSGCPVFAVTSNQGVHLVDAKTGDVVDSFAAKGKSAFPAAVDAVWVVRRNGEIMLWRRLYGKGLRGFIQRTDVWATAWVLIGLSVWSLWIRVQRRRRLGG